MTSLTRGTVYCYYERGMCTEARPAIYTGRQRFVDGETQVLVINAYSGHACWVFADELSDLSWVDYLEPVEAWA
jgi:hypothetical protein